MASNKLLLIIALFLVATPCHAMWRQPAPVPTRHIEPTHRVLIQPNLWWIYLSFHYFR